MNKLALWLYTVILLFGGCAMPARQTLDQINPTRNYHASLAVVMQAARLYSLKEGFKIERFEQEYGRVMGFKRTTEKSLDQNSRNPENRMIVMNLRLKRVGEQATDLTASFTFGDGQTVTTRDEERLLVECYTALFEHLENTLPR